MDRDISSTTCRNCDDARQGVTGHHVRKVLGWGVIATILSFAVVAVAACSQTNCATHLGTA